MTRPTRARLVVASTLSLLASGLRSSPASATTPRPIFDAAVIDQALPSDARRLLIFEASPGNPASGRAAEELLEGLARLGGTGIRVKDVPAPSPGRLDDGEAVELCAARGTQALAVVEILTPEPHLMVVAKLWTSGGARGATLFGPAPPPSAAAGAGSRYVGFDDRGAWLGVTRRRLDGDAFYEAVGRPDLAASYRSRSAARTLLFLGSATTGTIGLLWGMGDSVTASLSSGASSFCRTITSSSNSFGPGAGADSCRDNYRRSNGPTYSLVLAGAMLLTGVLIPADTVGPAQREGLARAHNKGLRPDAELTVAPYLLPDAGGVMVGGHF